MSRYTEITKTAKKVHADWSNREIMQFHYHNPNGLLKQKEKLDEAIFKLFDKGACRYGAILAYGSGNQHAAETIRELSKEKRVSKIDRIVAINRMEEVLADAQEFIDKVNAQTTAAPVNDSTKNHAITPLQAAMLKKIAFDEFTPANGAMPQCAADTETWAEQIIETAQDKGVFTSLLNAELVWHQGTGKEAGLGLTEKGYQIFINSAK